MKEREKLRRGIESAVRCHTLGTNVGVEARSQAGAQRHSEDGPGEAWPLRPSKIIWNIILKMTH